MSARATPLRGDEGSTLPLVIAFGALALAIVLGVTAATSLYVERKRLFSLADGAALAGAESWDLDDVVTENGRPRIVLRDDDVEAAVGDYLDAAPHDGVDGLVVERADSPDGESARVSLSARWRPPVLSIFLPEGFTIDVESTSRSVLQ